MGSYVHSRLNLINLLSGTVDDSPKRNTTREFPGSLVFKTQ